MREKYTIKISIIFLFYNSKLNVLNVVRQLIAKRFKGRNNFVFIKFETSNTVYILSVMIILKIINAVELQY